MKVNNRQIVAVYIRGLAFKCASGSRREQVLNALLKLDGAHTVSITLVVTAAVVVGWGVGVLTAWWII